MENCWPPWTVVYMCVVLGMADASKPGQATKGQPKGNTRQIWEYYASEFFLEEEKDEVVYDSNLEESLQYTEADSFKWPERCQDDYDCMEMIAYHSVCVDIYTNSTETDVKDPPRKCVCDKEYGYFPYNDTCVYFAALGEPCSSASTHCVDLNARCLSTGPRDNHDQICTCLPGYTVALLESKGRFCASEDDLERKLRERAAFIAEVTSYLYVEVGDLMGATIAPDEPVYVGDKIYLRLNMQENPDNFTRMHVTSCVVSTNSSLTTIAIPLILNGCPYRGQDVFHARNLWRPTRGAVQLRAGPLTVFEMVAENNVMLTCNVTICSRDTESDCKAPRYCGFENLHHQPAISSTATRAQFSTTPSTVRTAFTRLLLIQKREPESKKSKLMVAVVVVCAVLLFTFFLVGECVYCTLRRTYESRARKVQSHTPGSRTSSGESLLSQNKTPFDFLLSPLSSSWLGKQLTFPGVRVTQMTPDVCPGPRGVNGKILDRKRQAAEEERKAGECLRVTVTPMCPLGSPEDSESTDSDEMPDVIRHDDCHDCTEQTSRGFNWSSAKGGFVARVFSSTTYLISPGDDSPTENFYKFGSIFKSASPREIRRSESTGGATLPPRPFNVTSSPGGSYTATTLDTSSQSLRPTPLKTPSNNDGMTPRRSPHDYTRVTPLQSSSHLRVPSIEFLSVDECATHHSAGEQPRDRSSHRVRVTPIDKTSNCLSPTPSRRSSYGVRETSLKRSSQNLRLTPLGGTNGYSSDTPLKRSSNSVRAMRQSLTMSDNAGVTPLKMPIGSAKVTPLGRPPVMRLSPHLNTPVLKWSPEIPRETPVNTVVNNIGARSCFKVSVTPLTSPEGDPVHAEPLGTSPMVGRHVVSPRCLTLDLSAGSTDV